MVHTLTINYRMSGLIYSAIRKGLDLDISPKITLRPDSSAAGLDRTLRGMSFSDNRTCVHHWVGSWAAYHTDRLSLSQVLRRAPSWAVQAAARNCSLSSPGCIGTSPPLSSFKVRNSFHGEGNRTHAATGV